MLSQLDNPLNKLDQSLQKDRLLTAGVSIEFILTQELVPRIKAIVSFCIDVYLHWLSNTSAGDYLLSKIR